MESGNPFGSDVENPEEHLSNPVVAAHVARFYVESPKQQCSPEGVATAMGSSEGPLHPPALVEDALEELHELGVLRVTLESEPAGQRESVRIYELANYMGAQTIVKVVDSVSNSPS